MNKQKVKLMSSFFDAPCIATNKCNTYTDTHAKTNDNIHHYRVGYVPNGGKRTPSPAINLGGRWLSEFGFNIGGQVTVAAKPGLLIIKAA